jgi:GDP-L-fucose synthase
MKILVTGASGLVGSALINEYQLYSMYNPMDEWIFLSSKDGNLTKEDEVRSLFKKHQPNIVIHLAANVGGLFKNMHKKIEMYEDNLLMNTFVLKYARLHKVQKIITMLSTCIFPDGIEPLTEAKLHEGPPHPSNEGYAYAKRMMELHGRILEKDHGINCIQLIPTNIYGPYDNFNLEDAHVLPALIHRCYQAKQDQVPFIIKGSGKPIRQFIYNYDLAKIILYSVYESIPSGRYICSPPSQQEQTIEQVARKVASCMDYEQAIQFDTGYADGQYKKTVEPNIAFSHIPFTDFDEAIKQTVDWFIAAYENHTARI